MSCLSCAGYAAYLAGPPVLGFIGEHLSLNAAFGAVALLMLLPLVLARRLCRGEH